MKILSSYQLLEVDKITLEKQKIESIELMERAANAFIYQFIKLVKFNGKVILLCGKGNNGGDGLAIARLLSQREIDVEVCILEHSQKESQEFKVNLEKLKTTPEIQVHTVQAANQLKSLLEKLPSNSILIDAILGIGINKEPKGLLADCIQIINQSEKKVIAVDVPSGLQPDTFNIPESKTIIEADITITFQMPKLAFFFPENYRFTGDFYCVDIQLDTEAIATPHSDYYLGEKKEMKSLVTPRSKFSHKGLYGHTLLICGSKGKMGAALLASKACLRSGTGLLTTHLPHSGNIILQTYLPEAMTSIDENEDTITSHPKLEPFSSIGIGPGIGIDKLTANCLKSIIQNCSCPMVIDADAITILSQNKTWISFLPPETILTPHPKEFDRLTGSHTSGYERLQTAREFAFKFKLIIVLKGAYTAIIFPDKSVQFNPSGSPALAKGGTGDVLTGMICGLLSRGYKPSVAVIIAVYLHGLAGELAAEKTSEESVLAQDVIAKIGKAFRKIETKKA